MKRSIIILAVLLLSCNRESEPILTSNADYFNQIGANDIPMGTPREGEWLYAHHENGQTFEQYRKSNPFRPADSTGAIYLKPVGSFTDMQQKLMELTRQYVEIFFQHKTVLQPAASDKSIPEWGRRWRTEGYEQLYAPYILDSMLKNKMPEKGIASMAISEKDLFPSADWNFVFGLASYENRVGVSSIFRLEDEHLDSSNFTKTLLRLIKVTTHEIGHMLSLHHCTHARCVMNGSNHLGETDATPARACSECQKKLLWNLRYDNGKRLQELTAFFGANGLLEEMDQCRKDVALAN
jgi:archaemetzincin